MTTQPPTPQTPRVLLVSSNGPTCGIAEHSRQLMSTCWSDPSVSLRLSATALDPQAAAEEWVDAMGPPYTAKREGGPPFNILHLNYHRGLHSRWTPDSLRDFLRQFEPAPKVVITFHDTYEQHTPSDLAWGLRDVCDAMVVHEDCDLRYWQTARPDPGVDAGELCSKVLYWRQGVPARQAPLARRDVAWRPSLGVFGHDFPWKNYDTCATLAQYLGWSFTYVGPRLSTAREEGLRTLSGDAASFWYDPSSETAVSALTMCSATAFLYTCANSGTSGAIRWGLAAGRPVLATHGCRQFRDLEETPHNAVQWVESLSMQHLAERLTAAPTLDGWSIPALQLAALDSWANLGRKYAALYRALLSGGRP